MFDFEDSPWKVFRVGYLIHILILSCFSLWDIRKMFWILPFTIGNLVTVIFVLVVSALIAMILDIFKYHLECFHEKHRTNRETKCRREQMIGFGGVLLCGIVPQLVVYYCKDYVKLITITSYVSAISILTFKKFFLETPFYYVKSINYANRKVLLITFSVIYFLGLIAFMISGIFSIRAKITILLFFGITGFTATIELLMVLLEPFEMRTELEWVIEKLRNITKEAPGKPRDQNEISFNDICMISYSVLAVAVVILTILAGLWSLILYIVLIGSIIIWFISTLEKMMNEKRGQMDELEFCTARLKMGFFGILGIWCATQVSLYFVSFELKEVIEVNLPLLIFALSTYYHFIHGYRDTCNLNYHKFKSSIIKTMWILIFIGMIVCRISMSSENRYQNFQMGCIQTVLFFMPLGTLPELLVVMKGGVYLVDVEEQDPQPPEEPVSPELKCHECQQKYSAGLRIPRVLKECGHTICEQCADQRLNEHRGKYLYCPVCRMATVVKGAASLLTKNWAALEMMENN